MNTTTCSTCGASIIFAKTAEGKSLPLNAKPVPVYGLNPDGMIEKYAPCFISHFLTCNDPAAHSRKSQPAAQQQQGGGQRGGEGVQSPIAFGKHKGTPIIKLPTKYLEWCLENIENLHDSTRRLMEEALRIKGGAKKVEPEHEGYGSGQAADDELAEFM